MSVDLNLNSINFTSSVRSKPVRENFTDIENGVNDLQAQINVLATPPAGTEVTNARDYHSVLRDRLRSGFSIFDRYHVSGGVVAQDTGTNMKVTITAGESVVAGVGCKYAGQTSGTITPDVTNPRWDTVVVNTDNSISIVAGTAAASPVLPTIASTQKKLAHLYITAGMTQIVNADITDARKESSIQSFFNFEPIGTIKAWHKSFTNTPALVKGDAWKECDGTTIDDPESPYYTQTIPDLNGGKRFLRGSSTSGTLQATQNLQHTHTVDTTFKTGTISGALYADTLGEPASGYATVYDITKAGVVSNSPVSPSGDDESRPINMSVVWIMRIK